MTKQLNFISIGWALKLTGRINKPDDAPIYMQISLGNIILRLTEHHGDCSPGARAYINKFEDLKNYHKQLLSKQYKFIRPGLKKTPWNSKTLGMDVIDWSTCSRLDRMGAKIQKAVLPNHCILVN